MQYRIDKETLLNTLSAWDSHLGKKVHLIACGGTALTLLGVKESTKDVDLIMPLEDEYRYLIGILEDLGYEAKTGAGWSRAGGFIFEIYKGNRVFTTELLESPLTKGGNIPIKEFEHIYLGALNYYDLITSKIFRSSYVDIDDCLTLFRARGKEVNIGKLKKIFYETSSYDISDKKNISKFKSFLSLLQEEGYKI